MRFGPLAACTAMGLLAMPGFWDAHWENRAWAAAIVSMMAVGIAMNWWAATVRIYTEGLVVSQILGARFIPWADIDSVTAEAGTTWQGWPADKLVIDLRSGQESLSMAIRVGGPQ